MTEKGYIDTIHNYVESYSKDRVSFVAEFKKPKIVRVFWKSMRVSAVVGLSIVGGICALPCFIIFGTITGVVCGISLISQDIQKYQEKTISKIDLLKAILKDIFIFIPKVIFFTGIYYLIDITFLFATCLTGAKKMQYSWGQKTCSLPLNSEAS